MKKYSSKRAKKGKTAYRIPSRFFYQTSRVALCNRSAIKQQHQKITKCKTKKK